MLEEKVDEKYFLSDKMIKYLTNPLAMNGGRKKVFMRNFDRNKEIASTITCAAGNRPPDNYILVKESTQKGYVETYEGEVVVLGNYSPSGHNASRIVDNNGIAPTVMENHGTVTATVVAAAQRGRGEGWKQEIEVSDREYANAITTVSKDSIVATKEFIIGSTQKHTSISTNGICPTLTEAMGKGGGHIPMHNIGTCLRIRKLTPKECWRLMGFSDDDFDKAEKINSNTQLYKQAGNSIVVNVLMAIFKQFLN